MRNLFLPAWYLPNGTINAAENQLEEASSSCERWGIWCGILVVVSVVVELVIAWVEPPYNTFLEASAITDAGVGIGIVGEVLFGMFNNRIQTELRTRSNDKLGTAVKTAGEANERAAKLEREAAEARGKVADIERLTAWRHIHSDDAKKVVDAIRPIVDSLDVLIEYEASDRESYAYSVEFWTIFSQAGAKVRFSPNSYPLSNMFGVFLSAEGGVGGGFVASQFAKAKVTLWVQNKDLSTHLSNDEDPPNLYIFVAPRPPPFITDPIDKRGSVAPAMADPGQQPNE